MSGRDDFDRGGRRERVCETCGRAVGTLDAPLLAGGGVVRCVACTAGEALAWLQLDEQAQTALAFTLRGCGEGVSFPVRQLGRAALDIAADRIVEAPTVQAGRAHQADEEPERNVVARIEEAEHALAYMADRLRRVAEARLDPLRRGSR